MNTKLRNLIDASARTKISAPKLGRGTLNIRTSRRVSTVVAMIAAALMVGFGGVTAIAATSGNIVVTTTNPNPPLDIETQNYAPDAGVVGDQIIIKSNVALTGPVTATFAQAGGGTVAATVTPGGAGTFDTFTLTIPAGATTGALTVSDNAAHQGIVSPYGIWASRTEPYVMPSGHINLTYGDLKYILDQIKFGEAHAARTSNATTVVANSYSNLNSLAIKSGTALTYNTANASKIYPYDVLSATRCLQPVDLTTAATAAYGQSALSNGYAYSNLDPWGVRQVDGECNNITKVVAETPTTYTNTVPNKADTAGWGASDQFFTRLATPTNKPGTVAPYTLSAAQKAYSNPTSYVKDAAPRVISNLISDQTSANQAAVAAGNYGFGTLYGSPINTEVSVNATNTDKVSTVVQIPNVTADYNVSAGYDSWFTLFGQFFDHGLDLIPKGGSQVFIPLDQSDPLYIDSPTAQNYMILTRGADATGEQINITSPWVDQSQTYGSVASQNAFLREYAFTGAGGAPVATGALIEGTDFYARNGQTLGQATGVNGLTGSGVVPLNGGLATWWDIKNQAYRMGFQLSDWDAGSIPILATNQYGKLITGTNGFPLMLFKNATNQYLWVEGNKNTPIWTFPRVTVNSVNYGNAPGTLDGYTAVSTGHSFINDTMSSAVPNSGNGARLIPDADTIINAAGSVPTGYYDNESLNEHYVAGDGRVNENIGLSAVHNTFHGEHNLLTHDIKTMLMNNPAIPASFLAEFLVNKNSTNAAGDAAAGSWDGDRIYNAARFVCEMEYQHMVYDEFIRRISPGLPIFLAYQPNTRPDITQEFASAVYRLGHSMLNETIARSNPGTVWDPSNNQDVSLVTAFTNPSQARLPRPIVISGAQANAAGNSITYYVQTGTNEPLPEAGSVLSISGLSNSALNIQNAVVDSNNGSSTFTVTTRYPGGSSGSAVAVSVASNASGSSKTYAPVTGPDSNWTTKEAQSSGVVRLARASITNPGTTGYTYTPGESAAAIAQGMSQQRGNEIDEFTTDAVRNNLLGAPLDLPSLNLTRGRDTGLPTLNQFRATTAGALKPYKSWNDFIAALRYPESAVNFIAAYGTDTTITTKTVASVTKVSSGPTQNTYTTSDISGLKVGDVVTVSGFGTTARFNLKNAIIASIVDTDGVGAGVAGTFTVQKYYLTSPSAPTAFVATANPSAPTGGLTNLLKDVTPQPLANVGTLSSTITKAGSVTRDTTVDERRAAAQALMGNGAFMSSTGVWALKETGFNNVDLWIGGLAENPAKQPLTPPMLGPTFQYVFDKQTLALQNGDRFYYLGRILGTNLNEEIPAQQLTDIVRRNSPSAGNSMIQPAATSGLVGMNSPGFSVSDCFFTPDAGVVPNSIDNSQGGNDFANNNMGNTACPADTMRDDTTNNVYIHDGLDNVVGFGDQNSTTGIRIAGGAGDDSIQGTSGDDFLSGGASGGDLIYGYVGDDVLIGGPGEDLIKGGAGNDVLDMGESQAGDIADGNSGSDFIHNSNSTGVAASAIGEAGDDYIQGGTNNDALLEGGEGSDWIEAGGGLDVLNGDAGPNAGLVDMLNGGDDVMDGGAGNDIINSDGGDDVVNLGDGSDLVGMGTGFDWINYEATTRFDNGPATKPGVFIELAGGALPNPTLMPVDAVLDAEGVSGSPGNDTIIGRQAQNQVLTSTPTPITVNSAANVVYGKAGLNTLSINATATTIDGGMYVTGNGIPKGTQTVGPPALFTDATGLTTLQILLTSPLTANVTGNVSFKVWPLKRAGGVKGLSDLISGTPGATVGSVVPLTVAGEWTGGTLMVGGAGNDKLYAMGGSNVIHGSVQLHTCIVVTHNGAPFDQNSDTTCEGRNGYTGMTPLIDFMNSGQINPKDLRVVKELVSTAEPIIAVNSTGGLITYTTTSNKYEVGELVTVNGLAAAYNVNRATITAATANSFTVSVAATATVGSISVSGSAVQSDDLYLPGLAAAYTIERLSVLPLGATSGYKITGPTGIDYVYDVQRIVFDSLANVAPTPLVLGNNPASLTNNTGLSAAATTLGITAGQLILSPAWDPSIHNYTAIASGASVTTVPTGTGAIWVNGVAKRGTTGTTVSTTLTLTGGAGTLVYNFGTNTTNTYTVNIVAGGRVSTFDTPNSTGDGFVVNVTNCDKNLFTYTTSVPGGTASVGPQIGNNCAVTVSGLGTRQASTLAVTATPTAAFGANTPGVGYVTGISSVGTAAPVVFDQPVGTETGFTVNIISAVAGFTYTGEVIGIDGIANVSFGTITNGVLPVTVTGLLPTEQGMLTVTATRTNFPTSSGSVLASAGGTIQPANTPTFGAPSSTGSGFTFHINNYSALFDYSFSVQALTSTTADVDLSDLANGNVTVTGLAANESALVVVGTSRSGYLDGSATITFLPTSTPGIIPTVSAVTKTADGFTFDITNYDDNALHYNVSTSAGSVAMTSTQLGTATVTVTGLGPGESASVTVEYTEPLRSMASKVVSDSAQGGAALTPVLTGMTPLASGFTFQVTNYNPIYTWNVTGTNGATISAPSVAGNTATYTVSGLNTNGTSVITVETVRTNYGTGSAVISGNAFQSGLTVTRGATTKAATTTLLLSNYDATYTYVVSWSYTSATGAVVNGTAASISIATTGANAGRITITGVPAAARGVGAVMRVNVTTSKQYFTSVLTILTF